MADPDAAAAAEWPMSDGYLPYVAEEQQCKAETDNPESRHHGTCICRRPSWHRGDSFHRCRVCGYQWQVISQLSVKVVVDPDMPPGEAELRSGEHRARMVNIAGDQDTRTAGVRALNTFPLSYVRIQRLYRAACLYCTWKGEIHGYSDRHLAEDEKRAHVAEHRRGARP